MHARMTMAEVKPGRFDEAIRAVEEGFAPAAREQPGYAGFLLLADREGSRLVGISFWESAADLEASSGDGGGYYRQRLEGFAELVTSPPTTTVHEVLIREP